MANDIIHRSHMVHVSLFASINRYMMKLGKSFYDYDEKVFDCFHESTKVILYILVCVHVKFGILLSLLGTTGSVQIYKFMDNAKKQIYRLPPLKSQILLHYKHYGAFNCISRPTCMVLLNKYHKSWVYFICSYLDIL